MIIAVDGPAASGKGTLAGGLAAHYGLPHLDTGLLYRAVGLAAEPLADQPGFQSRAIEAARTLDFGDLQPKLLVSQRIGNLASKVSGIPGVRQALLQLQRDFASQPGGAVLDGRDIGTQVCPGADVKLFIVAEPRARALRRAGQFEAMGQAVDFEALLAAIEERDSRDRSNPHGGFYPAPDAHLLDTTQMDIEAALRAAVAIVDEVGTAKGKH